MCPFKKAIPLALLLHLLMAVGIVGAYAERQQRHVFTLLPAQGSATDTSAGSPAPRCPLRPLLQLIEPAAPPAPSPAAALPTFTPPPLSAPTSSPSSASASPSSSAAPTPASIAADSSSASSRLGGAIATHATGRQLIPPVALHKPQPRRPSSCPKGEVILTFTITTEGLVSSPHILHSPSPAMSEAVLAILPHWRFTPAKHPDTLQAHNLKVRQVIQF
jgi:TonB family protein